MRSPTREQPATLCSYGKSTCSNAVSAWPKINEWMNKDVKQCKKKKKKLSHFGKYWLGIWQKESESHSVVSNSVNSPWNSPGRNTGVGSLSLHPGDLPNPGIQLRSPALQECSLPAELPRKQIVPQFGFVRLLMIRVGFGGSVWQGEVPILLHYIRRYVIPVWLNYGDLNLDHVVKVQLCYFLRVSLMDTLLLSLV